jgi:uncharacterized protein (TIGR02145 family)
VGGGASIIVRGVCYSINTNPTIANSKTLNGSGTGSFTSSIFMGVTDNTKYYVRAYATNDGGTAYGNQLSLTTLASISTTAISNVTATTASSGGTIALGGGASITARGVCWSTNTNPTIADSKISNGIGTGSFTSSLTGLLPNTKYYVRAYATNGGGTTYGLQQSFTTDLATISDWDGNIYNLIRIGTQLWMKENLKTTHYAGGTTIPLVTNNTTWANLTAGAYCWYNNDESNYKATYGALYNWYAVNNGNLCPTGWHVPSDAEWKTLEMYLGMSQSEADKASYRGTEEGCHLKEAGSTHWTGSNNGVNSSGFTALPGGYRGSSGVFSGVGQYGFLWSASESITYMAWSRWLMNYGCQIARNEQVEFYGMSVRCIKN